MGMLLRIDIDMKLSNDVLFDNDSHVCEMDLRHGEEWTGIIKGGGLVKRLVSEIRRLRMIRQKLINEIDASKGR